MDKTKVNIPERFKDHPIFNEKILGTNFGFLAKRGWYLREEAKKQPELMHEMGINWTTLNMNFCQDEYYSQKVYIDFEYSTGEIELVEMTKRLHDKGIRVLFKPCLTPLDGQWMGAVKFPQIGRQIEGVERDYWGKWFKSFTEAEKYFADLAERAGMDAMIIGAEYHGTEGENERWENVIKEIRDLYSNPITYEFTFESRKDYDLEWFKKLDFLSYSYYPPACPWSWEKINQVDTKKIDPNSLPTYTYQDMVQFLKARKERIHSISERFDNMPIAFTEYGIRSSHGSIMFPCNFLWDGRYDGEEQANYMDASFEVFHDMPEWMGLFWWKWDETQNRPHYHGDPNGDRGFTIQGKPAETVMRKWSARLRGI